MSKKNKGYLYTTNIGLSSRLATQNSVESVMAAGRFRGRSLVDVGCGDGHYSLQYWDATEPRSLTGVDAAERAVELANKRKGQRQVTFRAGDSHNLPFASDSFDIALLQALLHHDDDPLQTIREAFRVAPEVVIHEPNGCNLGLKIIEKLSPYHREHAEKSYTHFQLRKWIEQGGRWYPAHSQASSQCFVPIGLPRLPKLWNRWWSGCRFSIPQVARFILSLPRGASQVSQAGLLNHESGPLASNPVCNLPHRR